VLALRAGKPTPTARTGGSPIGADQMAELQRQIGQIFGGSARIVTPGGNTLPGTWSAAGGQMCLNNGAAQECWPYASPFQAGQPVTLTSSCNSTSTWLASATNTAPPPAPKGERGR